jgi:hypothetical protein
MYTRLEFHLVAFSFKHIDGVSQYYDLVAMNLYYVIVKMLCKISVPYT